MSDTVRGRPRAGCRSQGGRVLAHLSSAQSVPPVSATTDAARLRASIRASSPKDGCDFSFACRAAATSGTCRLLSLPCMLCRHDVNPCGRDEAPHLVDVHDVAQARAVVVARLGHAHLVRARLHHVEPAHRTRDTSRSRLSTTGQPRGGMWELSSEWVMTDLSPSSPCLMITSPSLAFTCQGTATDG